MFALAALVCFLLALFGAHVGIDLVVLGLAFLAAHLLLGAWPFGTVRRRP